MDNGVEPSIRPTCRARRLKIVSPLATIAVATHAAQEIWTQLFSCMGRSPSKRS
jgi:hypothetical protein